MPQPEHDFPFAEDRVSSWEEAKGRLRELWPGYAFRGQTHSGWDLRTTIERVAQTLPAPQVEALLMRAFRRRAHHYGIALPDDRDDLGWLALMQHHGAPTRLLDWTKSPYIAAFFAFKKEDTRSPESSIWAIDLVWLKRTAIELLRRRGGFEDLGSESHLGAPENFRRCFLETETAFVGPVQVERMNERLSLQQGLFLATGDLRKSFGENLLNMAPAGELREHVRRLDLPNHWRPVIMTDLFAMNISHATLFPGLDGYARSLGDQITTLQQLIGEPGEPGPKVELRAEGPEMFDEFGAL